MYLTEIDEEGVIAADTDPAQEMGDESVEVFDLLLSLGSVCKVASVMFVCYMVIGWNISLSCAGCI